jgi:pimeloyl-ACP methyl ester carboxylesterase
MVKIMSNYIGSQAATLLSALAIVVTGHAWAQAPVVWKDPSPHRVQLVRVDEDVRLEVLDWGGSGRAVILLAGAGNTAHVFDDFAPKLAGRWHVYGITRRGYGASGQPASGYDDQRLADDVVQAMDALKIAAPVLVGHSMAGGELTTIGRQHPDRITGLVYLDALGDPRDWTASDPKYMELARKLPPPMRAPAPPLSEEESKSFSGYRAWQMRAQKFAFPESELRNLYETNPDGSKGRPKTPYTIFQALGTGQKRRDYSGIRVPVLAFYEFPRSTEYRPDAGERAAIDAFNAATAAFIGRWNNNLLSGAGDVHFIDLPGAGHYVYLTREADVLKGLRTFLADLP